MNETIIATLIASGVSLSVALVSYIANRQAMQREIEKQENQMRRRMTEKLYDMRLGSYPLAFEITDALSGEVLFTNVDVEYLINVRDKLIAWNREHGFIMSDQAIRAYYALRTSLKMKQSEKTTTPDHMELQKIFDAKNDFRKNLRRDVNLLYVEET